MAVVFDVPVNGTGNDSVARLPFIEYETVADVPAVIPVSVPVNVPVLASPFVVDIVAMLLNSVVRPVPVMSFSGFPEISASLAAKFVVTV